MSERWDRIKGRKLVQWAIAYLAAATLVIGIASDLAQGFAWAVVVLRAIVAVLAVGFMMLLVIAWYHGERGSQKVTGFEIALLGGLTVLGGFAALFAVRGGTALPARDGRAPSLASDGYVRIGVLPCDLIPAGPELNYLAIGLADQVIAQLARSHNLRPIALSSVMRYLGGPKNVRTIGRDLDVPIVLDCTIRSDSERVRVTFHLIHTDTEDALWAEPVTRDVGDFLGIEAEIATHIASTLQASLTADESRRIARSPTASEDAWFDYLRGRQFTRTTERELEIAISYFERAIGADPEFALAHAGLADAILSLGAFGLWPPREARDSARAAAQRALTFDDNLPEGIAAWAGVLLWFDWDWTGAEEAFKRARDLQPTSITARHNFASLLIALRRFDEASDLLRENVDLDPLNPYTHAVLGWAYYMGGQYTDAVSQLEQTRVRFPESAAVEVPLAWSYAALGRFSEAIAAADRGDASLSDDPWLSTSLAAVRAAAGRRTDAESTLTWLSDLQTRRYVDPHNFAVLLGVLGDTARALSELERAYHLGSPEMVFLDVNRAVLFHSAFGTTPRYEALVRQLRFPR